MEYFIQMTQKKGFGGLYYFAGYTATGKYRFECSWCNTGRTKIFKRKKNAENIYNRLTGDFPQFDVELIAVNMDKEQVVNTLNNFPNGIAEIVCDISSNGQVCYPDESILVVTSKNINPELIAKLKEYFGNYWGICESIDDFIEGIVYGEESARKAYCGYYVSNFKQVKAFEKNF